MPVESGKGFKLIDDSAVDDLPKGSTEWQAELRGTVKRLAVAIDHNLLDLGRLLFEVHNPENNPRIYESWGYVDFEEYCLKELSMKYARAMHFRRIYEVLEVAEPPETLPLSAKISPESKARLIALGWSKASMLARVINEHNIDIWTAEAAKCNYMQLQRAVADYLDKVKGNKFAADITPEQAVPKAEDFKAERLVFFTNKEQEENINLALETARKMIQYKASYQEAAGRKKGNLLDLICTDFNATSTYESSDMDERIRLLVKYENLLGVKLVIFDAATNDLLYGLDTLKTLDEDTDGIAPGPTDSAR